MTAKAVTSSQSDGGFDVFIGEGCDVAGGRGGAPGLGGLVPDYPRLQHPRPDVMRISVRGHSRDLYRLTARAATTRRIISQADRRRVSENAHVDQWPQRFEYGVLSRDASKEEAPRAVHQKDVDRFFMPPRRYAQTWDSGLCQRETST